MSGADDRRRAAAHVFVGTEELGVAGEIVLSTDTEHHLSRVLRLRDGAAVSMADGHGGWRIATVVGTNPTTRLEAVTPTVVEAAPDTPIVLAAAMPKGDRLDWMVQKSTELGVSRLQLLHADHSVVRWKSSENEKKIARLRRIAESAAQQSRRVWLPEILPPVRAADVIPEVMVAEPGGRALRLGDCHVAIGPEGGWSDAELELAGERVTLGPHVLRTETAALAAIALCVAVGHSDVQSRGT